MESQYQMPTKPCSKAKIHDFWSKIIADQISSEMDMQRFCSQHQLKFTSLRYWKYTSKIGKAICKNARKGNSIEPARFIPLQITNIANDTASKTNSEFREVQLIFNNGHRLILPIVISEANLSMIIKVVAAVLPC
jgi:hypothetical protein